MKQITHLCLPLALLLSLMLAGLPAGAQTPPVLVKLIDTNGTSILGELKKDDGEQVELIELKSGRTLKFKKGAWNDLRRGITDKEAVSTISLTPFLAWRIQKVIPTSTLTGRIAKIEAATIYVTLGAQSSIEKGGELIVFREGGEIKDPVTGDTLASHKQRIAKLTVIGVEDKVSRARMVGDFDVELKVGDSVEPASQSKAIAVLPFVDVNGVVRAGGQKMSEDVTTGLAQGGINIVERNQLSKVLAELGMQNTAGFDAEKAQKVGRQVGAYAMLLGTMGSSGYGSEVNLRLIKVETGEILFATKQAGVALGEIVAGTSIPTVEPTKPTSAPLTETTSSAEIKAPAGEGWVAIFNGRDFSGWKKRVVRGMPWRVENWEMVTRVHSRDGQNDYFTTSQYWNFNFRCEFKTETGSRSGIAVRGRHDVAITADLDAQSSSPTGTILTTGNTGIRPARLANVSAGRWQTLEITAVNNQITVVLNGVKIHDRVTLTTLSPNPFDSNLQEPGPILIRGRTGSVHFRNMYIKEIK